ncbi:CLC_0170 family protein [Caloranaerobacter ferrireducens]|uniref:CLC_0170 family protein n=1 Tax=Caloranaerobacter ferrireducens TaxID=1323370 RepID=UPI00084D9820|nr:CLC_0170 family protein [Caloranaerobacter ferrireducens]
MSLIKSVINELKELYSLYMVFLVVFIGLFTYFADGIHLKTKGNIKESTLAKIIGIVYIIGGPLFYVLLKIL